MSVTKPLPCCECEHVSHFPAEEHCNPWHMDGKEHPYASEVPETKPVKTDFGTFNMCLACIDQKHGRTL